MNDVIKCMKERRSIRKFKPEQIKEEELQAILEAGKYAPCGMGVQSAVMVVIQEKELRDKIAKLNGQVMGSDSDPFYGAPTVVVVFVEKNKRICVEDGSVIMANLLNAAHSVGVDSCWIHRAKEVFEGDEGAELLKQWGLEGYVGIANCILGYGDCEYPEAKPRKENFVIRA